MIVILKLNSLFAFILFDDQKLKTLSESNFAVSIYVINQNEENKRESDVARAENSTRNNLL
jgi:hypothetical protein